MSERRGSSLIYVTVAMPVLIMMCSLGVDLGRVQLAKTELQRACDAAARAGASGLPYGAAEVYKRVRDIASKNTADGSPVDIVPATDIEFWSWDLKTKKGTKLSGYSTSANAIRVMAQRTQSRGNAIPLLFGRVLNMNSCQARVECTAVFVNPINVNQDVLATANPFLSGMPKGAGASFNNPHNSPDYAGDTTTPRQSPMAVNGLPLVEGQDLTFDNIAGDARHDPNLAYYEPDGQLDDISHNTNNSENGIGDVIAPINALVGVFLDDNAPTSTSAPSRLDFSTAGSRDFTTLTPGLKQIFFIGDGHNSAGGQQEFVVPKGATRLFLATWDFYEWNNNAGFRTIKIMRPSKIITVK